MMTDRTILVILLGILLSALFCWGVLDYVAWRTEP